MQKIETGEFMLKKSLSLLIIIILFISCSADSGKTPAKNILFIGNSLTSYNGGINTHLSGLAPNCEIKSVAVSGTTLRYHWNDRTKELISNGKWDYIILQEGSSRSVMEYENYKEYIEKFKTISDENGSEIILYVPWGYPENKRNSVGTDEILKAGEKVTALFNLSMVPVGSAFRYVLEDNPDIELTMKDGHPNIHGTYFAACLFYGKLFGESPAGLRYKPEGISKEENNYLQRAAAEYLGL